MPMVPRLSSYEEFWPYYVSEHMQPITRRLHFVGTTLVDERPPSEANKPEVRTYEQIYVRNNQPVGQWSDSVRVTLQP